MQNQRFLKCLILAGLQETRQSLKEPNNAALTQATAEKFFGNWRSAIGKTIKVNNKTVYKITGILKNIPANSDFPLSTVVGYSALQNTYIKSNLNDWVSTFGDAYTFVVLPPELSPAKIQYSTYKLCKKT